jgi:DNA uptake protein ComE-like DNA-binding protein
MENDKSTVSIDVIKKLAEELGVDVMELLSDEKIVVQNNSSQDQSTFQGGIVINHQSAELFAQMKERIEKLKELIKEKDIHIQALERKENIEK